MCIYIVYISGSLWNFCVGMLWSRPPFGLLSLPVTSSSSEPLYTLGEKPWDLAYLSFYVCLILINTCLQDLSFLQRACFSSSLCTVVLPFMSTLSYLSVAWLYAARCEQRCRNRHYTGISEYRHNFLTIDTMACCS